MKRGQPFADLPALAAHLRGELENKKTILLYAYNGTGKTRLSIEFKNLGKRTVDRSHAPAWERRACRSSGAYPSGRAIPKRRDAGASPATFPRWSMGTINAGAWKRSPLSLSA